MAQDHRIAVESNLADLFDIRYERGWTGGFTRAQAPEAKFLNGDRVCKTVHEAGDVTPIGTQGTVLGSIYYLAGGVAYFIAWDDKPKVACMVLEKKVL